jgi:ATP-binding cassette subfamily C protein
VVEAAKKAAAHDMIVRLPDGYDTRVSALGGRLSGGQIQRIGLARALYGDPVIVVLDEPNSNLDNEGSMALNDAIKQMKAAGCAVLIMAHRPAAIQECDLLLVVEDGLRRAFGPRDQVLREMVKNHTEIAKSAGPGGVT